MNNNLISIIVACYNVESFVDQCISSILNQSYSNLEIIIVNDESTDATYQKLLEFKNIDKRIQIVNQKNKGLSQVRNEGIKLATGSYIMFVDGDDWLDANCVSILETQINDYSLACCSYNRVFKQETKPRKLNLSGVVYSNTIQRRIVGLVKNELQDPSQADSLVTAWGKLYKTNLIKENNINFIDTKLIGTEDALFNICYLQFADKITVIDEPLYFYRKYNANSLTNTYKSNLFDQWKLLYSHIFQIIKHKQPVFITAYHNRICLSIIGLGLNEMLNKKGFWARYSKLKLILNDTLYKEAYKNLDLKYFPIHWKMFFFFAKNKSVFLLMLMLIGIKKMIN
ncbi:glycosyltransferase family 2 protein [Flavobacterium sp.]|uniref:glycosyltransferase family 2 protein n=1 Tax=Flavobacterium sp. TaxID=239 RepID=UPI0037501937